MNRTLYDMIMMRDMARSNRGYGRTRDGRNPYGSAGGYITTRDPRRRDRTYSQPDYERDMRENEPNRRYDMGYYPFEVYGSVDMTGMDMARRRNSRGQYMSDRNMDGNYPYYGPMYMDYANGTKLSQEELEYWYEELCESIPQEYKHLYKKENIEQVAKQMQIEFSKFSPLELAVTATMLASDFKDVYSPSDIQRYVSMAKAWLCDKDSNLKYGERLAAYYDYIING